jgi:hypothetical protein
MNSVKQCWHLLQSVRAAFSSRPRRPLGLGLCGVALLGYTQLGVVDAEDGLSDDLDCLAGDFLLIRVFAGAQFALNQDRVALLSELANLVRLPHAATRNQSVDSCVLLALSVHFLVEAIEKRVTVLPP